MLRPPILSNTERPAGTPDKAVADTARQFRCSSVEETWRGRTLAVAALVLGPREYAENIPGDPEHRDHGRSRRDGSGHHADPEALARPDGRGAGCDKPVFLSIGLAGNGMVAMTILYSLRPA